MCECLSWSRGRGGEAQVAENTPTTHIYPNSELSFPGYIQEQWPQTMWQALHWGGTMHPAWNSSGCVDLFCVRGEGDLSYVYGAACNCHLSAEIFGASCRRGGGEILISRLLASDPGLSSLLNAPHIFAPENSSCRCNMYKQYTSVIQGAALFVFWVEGEWSFPFPPSKE